jgi:hypothetical protein
MLGSTFNPCANRTIGSKLSVSVHFQMSYAIFKQRGHMHTARSQMDTAATIRALAEKYKVAYTETATDLFGHHITRLSGDNVELDETELLLLALERAGYVGHTDAVRLHADYLRQAKL